MKKQQLPSMIFSPLKLKRAIGGNDMNFNQDDIFLKKFLPNSIYKIFNHVLHQHNFSHARQSEHLIIGNNPIINSMLLLSLVNKISEKQDIILVETDQHDFWYYAYLEKENDIKEILELSLEKEIKDYFYDVFCQLNIMMKKKNIRLFYIEENRLLIENFFEHKNKEFFIFKLNKRKNIKPEIDKNFEQDNLFRIKYKEIFQNLFYQYHQINPLFQLEITAQHRPNYIIAKHVYLTSLPQGWMTNISQENKNKINFQNDVFKHCFGSSKNIILKPQYNTLDFIQTKEKIDKMIIL